MTAEDLKQLIQEIVRQSHELKNKHTAEKNAAVNYSAVFSRDKNEYKELYDAAKQIGKVIKNTPTGDLFKVDGIDTVAGKLKLVKIRLPDPTRHERGDADFTLADYIMFKEKYLSKTGFKLIERKDFEMIELIDPSFNVRAYFSNPPLDLQLGLR